MKACNSCAKCCIKYSNGDLSASANEIEYWEVFRPQIARYVHDGKIWIDPETHKSIELCPWMRVISDEGAEQLKVSCDIYHDRPDDCRIYPVSIAEMINDSCEMLEKKDIENPKMAQKTLDIMMADSRPE
ncbi:MAG: YkgJ family cysteine cluster protein [Cocleimonas sp.]